MEPLASMGGDTAADDTADSKGKTRAPHRTVSPTRRGR